MTNRLSSYFEIDSSILTPDPELARIRGIELGVIAGIAEPISWESLALCRTQNTESCNIVYEVEQILIDLAYKLTHSRLKSLCWTVTAGRGHDVWETRDDHWEVCQALWLEVKKTLCHHKEGSVGKETRQPQRDSNGNQYHMHQFFGSAVYGRRVFVTLGGMIGLGPASLQQGDYVAVLFGGLTPFVLRFQDLEYLLVGECYVNGQMDGEAIEEWNDGLREDKAFYLR